MWDPNARPRQSLLYRDDQTKELVILGRVIDAQTEQQLQKLAIGTLAAILLAPQREPQISFGI